MKTPSIETVLTLLCFAAIIFVMDLIIVTDAELCAPYTPKERGETNILYCECDDKINQEPGHCEDKYKNDNE